MSFKTKHLVVVISGHGYGHAAMTAPLINSLRQHHPELKLTVRSGVPLAMLQRKFNQPFDYLPDSSDFGFIMHDAFSVDMARSLTRYQQFHRQWQNRLDEEVDLLEQLQADMLVSNIAYLPLLAARQLGLPSVAYCCLNWADIFQQLFPQEQHIHEQMLQAYKSADCFIAPEPRMSMHDLNTVTVGPIAEPGQARRQQLCDLLGLDPSAKLVLASMGGIKTDMQIANWPRIDGVHYLIPDSPPLGRDDTTVFSTDEFGFSDAICSCDVLFTKPGYGSFTEAALNRKAVLYVERPEWPEAPYLCDWLQRHTPSCSISQNQLYSGDFRQKLDFLLQQPKPVHPPKSGLPAAVELLENHLYLI